MTSRNTNEEAPPSTKKSTHGTLVSLLDELQSLEVASNSTAISSEYIINNEARFLKRVTLLHDALLELGFKEDSIQPLLVATSAVSLEDALDWACLHLSTAELPAFLTDQDAVVDSMLTLQDPHRLTVVVAAAVKSRKSDEAGEARSSESLTLVAPTPSKQLSTKDNDEKDKEDAKAAQKAWLLAQYQYEEDDGEDDDYMDENEEDENTENQQQMEVVATLTPLQQQLHRMEAEHKELDGILSDEAQQYMMGKHEIKAMKTKHKNLQRQLGGLRRKVQREEEQQQQEQQPSNNDGTTKEQAVNGNYDDGGGGMMNLFGGGDDSDEEQENNGGGMFDMPSDLNAPKLVRPPITPSPPLPVNTIAAATAPDYSIPNKWTGKTPKQLLEERCKKLKCGPPRFKKRGVNGVFVTIKCKPTPISIQHEGPFRDFKTEAQNYLAAQALYEMDSSLPIYRILPPVFRDLWVSWLDAAKQEVQAEKQQVSDVKEEKMKQIINAILAQRESTIKKDAKNGSKDSSREDDEAANDANRLTEDAIPDTWDDDESDIEAPSASAKVGHVSAEGSKLQNFFSKRRQTPQYKAMLEARQTLPMYSYRQELLDTIQNNQVTVLCAETGAGKTTQCGQFLLETALNDGLGDKIQILCTQPRRVSAISVAERVSEEFSDRKVGESIGYHIRLESKKSSRTKLLFCTTGVVLRRLQDDPNLEGITHVLVDEVHERQWQIDFLLIALRRLIHTNRKDLKVVLMSATLDAELFTRFFPGAPLLKVPGRTFPVTNYYLEDLIDATDHVIEEGSRYAARNQREDNRSGVVFVTTAGGEKRRENFSMEDDSHLAEVSDNYEGYKMATRRTMDRVNEQMVNYDLIEDILAKLLVDSMNNDTLKAPDATVDISSGAVLVFLPGVGEIQTLRERLEGSRTFGNRKRFDVIPMHSTLSPTDQRRAFVKSKQGCQKIILATNIAETSVTIPDVVCVIDSGLVREVHQNKRTSTSTLVTTWCSRASTKQRSGRAGRVQAGICCRLFSSRTANERMKDQAIPELQRVPLEEVCLSILAGRLGTDCMDFLTQAPQPPSERSVSIALDVLKDVGAINSEGQLAPLGYHLSKLPMDVRLGKMLIFGALFRCLDPILIVAASLSCKSPFPAFARGSPQAQARHKMFQHDKSDFMTICNVWKAFQVAHKVDKSRKFCDEHFLSRSALMEIKDTREQYLSLLCQIGFVKGPSRGKEVPPDYDKNGTKETVVSAVICAGLYPNVARIDSIQNGVPSLTHNKERVHIHKSSVNASKGAAIPTDWIVFYEKFATHRVYISDTAIIHPYSLLLFGGPLIVKHQDRKVLVGDWVEVPVAAQTGVLFRELRVKMDDMLRRLIEKPSESSDLAGAIVKLIESH